MKGLKVKLFKENTTPKTHILPLALCDKVSYELNKFQASGIKFSSWAAPVVPVIKRDGNIRLSRDYNLSMANNKVYPLPRIEEIFVAVSGGIWLLHILIYWLLVGQSYKARAFDPSSTSSGMSWLC